MNNKGQTLVIFVIILPILLIMFTLIIDLGFLYIEKKSISNNLYDAVEYYLDNINKTNINDTVERLINENISDIDNININDTDTYVEIKVIKTRKSLYSIVSNNIEIKVAYKGFKDDKRIIKG